MFKIFCFLLLIQLMRKWWVTHDFLNLDKTPSWMLGGPPRCPLSPILPPWGENPKKRKVSPFRRRHGAETYREEKAISDGKIPPGRSPPGREDRRHRHHHHHGHHRYHHQYHPRHQHH